MNTGRNGDPEPDALRQLQSNSSQPWYQTSEADSPAWRVLLTYAWPFRLALMGGALLGLATGATGLAIPLVVRELIAGMGGDRPVTGLVLLMTGLILADAAIGAFGNYILKRTGESIVLIARRGLVSRLLRLRLGEVESGEPGDLISRITADTTLLREVTTTSLVSTITQVLTLLAAWTLMALLDPVLFGVTLLVLAIAGAVIGLLVPQINRATRRAQESVGVMGAVLEGVFGSFRTVKAFGAEGYEEERLLSAATAAWREGVRSAKWETLAGNTAGLAVQVSFLVVLSVGGAQVAVGSIKVETLVAFLLYVFYLMSPIDQLVGAVTQYQIGAAVVTRLRGAARLPIEPSDPPGELPARKNAPASLAFKQVCFRYHPKLPIVHHDLSFEIRPGGITALVGPSGAGKTTIFSLIERFYEPASGRILIDGIDIKEWPINQLRAAIGYVEQDAPILSGTFRENLCFGAPRASPEDLHKVLQITRLGALVARLPCGLDTLVGHRGTKLSGGERQRLAIARALLRSPRLLLLDEATSQLDAVNEAALRKTIAEAAQTTTVLVVAHRLSTVTTADRILVVDAGQVRASGTHAELMATDSLYGELAATQFLVSHA